MKLTKKYWTVAGVFATIAAFALVYAGSYSQKTVAESTIKKVADTEEFRSIIDNADSGMLVFDLYADWCGPCRTIEPLLSDLAQKYSDKVGFYRINIDENPQIASMFRTNAIPYVVFVKNGKVIKSFAGVYSQSSYEKVIQICNESTELCEKL